MRAEFAERLRCPACRAPRPFTLVAIADDGREVRTGTLTCRACGHRAKIRDGIVDLMHEPPEFVRREAEGLGRFAQVMRDDGWERQHVMELPYREDGYWFCQAQLMEQTLDTVHFEPGGTILDLGSNTCWASAMFARNGLETTALDIAEHKMQGLRTAEWQFEDKDVFFERVLGVMFDLPFADGSFTYAWACEVLHHNHRDNLMRTLREVYRVLEPGGKLIVANEPLRTLMTPKINPGHEVAEFEGHEHAYMRFSYTTAAKRAGFEVDVRGPRYHATFQDAPVSLTNDMRYDQLFRAATVVASRRSTRLKQALLAARAYIVGGTALHMICTKPGG